MVIANDSHYLYSDVRSERGARVNSWIGAGIVMTSLAYLHLVWRVSRLRASVPGKAARR